VQNPVRFKAMRNRRIFGRKCAFNAQTQENHAKNPVKTPEKKSKKNLMRIETPKKRLLANVRSGKGE